MPCQRPRAGIVLSGVAASSRPQELVRIPRTKSDFSDGDGFSAFRPGTASASLNEVALRRELKYGAEGKEPVKWGSPRAASSSTETRFHPSDSGSASSAGRGSGVHPGFPSPKGSMASAKTKFPAALRSIPSVSARVFPRSENGTKPYVSTSRADANAPTLDRGLSKPPPCREGGPRCRGGQFTYGNEPKRVSSARHP